MYKISWFIGDTLGRTFIIVPDVNALFDAWWVITGYGRRDNCTPVNVIVTSLDGTVVDMTKGVAHAASYGTYAVK